MANDFSADTNCVALWSFESGAFTTDSKGANDLTDNNTVGTSATAKDGSQSASLAALSNESFSRADGDLDAGFPLKNGDSTKKISFCCWFQLASTLGAATYRNLVTKGDVTLGKRSFKLTLYNGFGKDEVRFHLGYNSGASEEIVTMIQQDTGLYATGTWYHIGFTYDDSTKGWYVKLLKEGDTTYEGNGTTTNNINVEDGGFAIGGYFDNGSVSGTYDWNGLIDEAVIFKDILSEAEIDLIAAGTYGAAGGTTISSDSIYKFDIRNILYSDSIGKYDIRGLIQSDSIYKYDILNQLFSDIIMRYDSRSLLQSDLIAVFDLFNLVQSDVIGKYDIRGLINSDLIAKYDQGGIVYSDLTGLFGILSSMMSRGLGRLGISTRLN